MKTAKLSKPTEEKQPLELSRGTFGKILTDLLNNHGLIQADLAKIIGCTRGAISHWRTGRSKPSQFAIMVMESFFEVSILEVDEGEYVVYKGAVPLNVSAYQTARMSQWSKYQNWIAEQKNNKQ